MIEVRELILQLYKDNPSKHHQFPEFRNRDVEQDLESVYITAEKYVNESIMTENRNLNMVKGENSKADVTQLQAGASAGKQISICKRDYVNMEESV